MVFIRGWSQRHLLPSIYQNSRLPKGKQVFIANHMVFAISLDTASQLHHLGDERNTPRAKLPETRQGPTLQAGLPKESSLRSAMLTLFCTVAHIGYHVFSLNTLSWSDRSAPLLWSAPQNHDFNHCIMLPFFRIYHFLMVRQLDCFQVSAIIYNYLVHICKHESL